MNIAQVGEGDDPLLDQLPQDVNRRSWGQTSIRLERRPRGADPVAVEGLHVPLAGHRRGRGRGDYRGRVGQAWRDSWERRGRRAAAGGVRGGLEAGEEVLCG